MLADRESQDLVPARRPIHGSSMVPNRGFGCVPQLALAKPGLFFVSRGRGMKNVKHQGLMLPLESARELSIDPVADERLGWATGRAGAS